jgi:hypothetical protein
MVSMAWIDCYELDGDMVRTEIKINSPIRPECRDGLFLFSGERPDLIPVWCRRRSTLDAM